MRKVKNIENIFPVWKIEQDMLLMKDGSIGVVYAVTLPEIFTMSSEEYVNLHSAFVKALKVLTPGMIVHKQDWFLEANYQAKFATAVEDDSFLNHSARRHFHERAWLDHSCYLYFVFPPNGKHAAAYTSNTLFAKSIVPAGALEEKHISQFLDEASQFLRIVAETGLVAFRRLDEEAITVILQRYMSLSNEGDSAMVRDLVLNETMQVGEKHCQVFSMADASLLPSACGPRITYDKYSTDATAFSIGFAAPIGLLLHGNHIVNQVIIVQDAHELGARLEKRRLKLQSLSGYSRSNSIARDAVNEYLQEMTGQGRQPVKLHISLTAFTDDRQELRSVRNQVAAGFSVMDAGVKLETDCALQLFWSAIPGNAASLPVAETVDTFAEQACCFLNLETNYRSSSSVFGIRLSDRLSGVPLHVDLSDVPMKKGWITNRNKFVLGPSGSGKSVFCNHVVRSYIEQGAHCVIVDVGHSYQVLCKVLGGYYYTYAESSPICFNPFAFEGAADIEKKESIKTLLLALWKKDDETFSRSEYVALGNALDGYYKADALERNFNTFYEYVKTEFAALLKNENVTAKEFDLANFLYVLRPFYNSGEYDYLLNDDSAQDMLNQRLIVFELDNIKDHPILFPVVTLIIMEVFISKMRKLKGVRKVIQIEEAWKAIARAGMAEYMKYLNKTVRKFFGETVIVTQDIDDIINSPIVKDTIINNSDCKILLDMSRYMNRFEYIQKLLGLSEKDKALVLSLNKSNDASRRYKEVFISLGGHYSKVYALELSLEEYLTYTTEEKEKIRVLSAIEQHGSAQLGIKRLAQEIREEQNSKRA